MSSEQTGWDHRYRRLPEGETILPTDECQNDDGSWKVTRPEVAGSKAPNPDYTSHRTYRRLTDTTPPPASADALGEVERVARALWFDHVDQIGYPNGMPTWDEMSEHSTDKPFDRSLEEFRSLATAALSAMSPAGEVENKPCKNCGFVPENTD